MPLARRSKRARPFYSFVPALFLSSCVVASAGDLQKPETATGSRAARVELTLSDAESKRPVSDASVDWHAGERRGSGTTDATGKLSFVAADAPSQYHAHERLHLTISANVYRRERRSVRIEDGKTTRVEVALHPRSPHEIGVVLGFLGNTDTGRGIAHADVELIGAGAVRTTTDADGLFRVAPVGFSDSLRLRFTTTDPPCIRPFETTIVVHHPAEAVLASATDLRLPVVHCPPELFIPVVGVKPSLPHDTAIHWHQADLLAIQMSEPDDAWHAGHVNDILKLEPESGMLVATDTGGVWAITSGGQALPLSNAWFAANVTSLAAGPDGARHVYAGTQPNGSVPGGVLWETNTSTGAPTLNWSAVEPKPPCDRIDSVLVIAEKRRIVLACDSGIKWAAIPPAPSATKPYTWINGTPVNLPQGNHFSALAKGPGWSDGGEGTIVAAKWGGFAPGTAIYHGGWSAGALRLGFSTVDPGPGNLFVSMGRTSLAACAADRQRMFAVAEDGANNMAGVWRSGDAGTTWQQMPMPPDPGGQGNYNNAIAVSPDCQIVALGWQAGTFVSYDAGQSWTLLSGGRHLHGDVHGLAFDPADASTLFIGSDGGVASASGLGLDRTPTFVSNWNRQLLDLQLYHNAASAVADGFVAEGLQDNGVVFTTLPGPWRHLTDCGCDGRWTRFIGPPGMESGTSILLDEEWGVPDWPFSSIRAIGSSITGKTTPIPVAPPSSGPLTNVVTAAVRSPGFTNAAGQAMYAVGGSASGIDVYGLFADDNGDNLHWERLGGIGGGQKIWAVSPTFNGQAFFVGTDAGNIFRFDAPYGQSPLQLGLSIPAGASGPRQITGLTAFFSGVAFATVNIGGRGYVMSLKDDVWSSVGSGLPHSQPFKAIAAPDVRSIFVATDTTVYDTHDSGTTWNDASDGLPSVITAADLQVANEPSGGTFLYLASFGRSLWRAQLP
jgi:hypothetical protein